MRKPQLHREASASSTEGPQNAQRQKGFSPPEAITEIPWRDPQMQPQGMRQNELHFLFTTFIFYGKKPWHGGIQTPLPMF